MTRSEHDHLRIYADNIRAFADYVPKDLGQEVLDAVDKLVGAYEQAMHETALAQSYHHALYRDIAKVLAAKKET